MQTFLPEIVEQSEFDPQVTNKSKQHFIGRVVEAAIPFLQTFSAAQYSPAGQTVLQELVLGLVQIFTPFCEDSLQTVFVS